MGSAASAQPGAPASSCRGHQRNEDASGYQGLRSAHIKIKVKRPAFAFWSKQKRAKSKALLQHLSPAQRMAQLRAWWRNVSDEATAPFDALAKADVLRHRRQTTVADVVHEMVSHLAGDPLIPRAPKNGHLFPEPDDFRSSSATGTSSNSSTSDSSSMAVSQPLDNVPVAVAGVIYPSLCVASAPADVACKLFDVLERCCDCALEDPGCNPAPSPASDGLWYSVTVSRFGPLGVSLATGDFPAAVRAPVIVPLIESRETEHPVWHSGCSGGMQVVMSTHIGGVCFWASK